MKWINFSLFPLRTTKNLGHFIQTNIRKLWKESRRMQINHRSGDQVTTWKWISWVLFLCHTSYSMIRKGLIENQDLLYHSMRLLLLRYQWRPYVELEISSSCRNNKKTEWVFHLHLAVPWRLNGKIRLLPTWPEWGSAHSSPVEVVS